MNSRRKKTEETKRRETALLLQVVVGGSSNEWPEVFGFTQKPRFFAPCLQKAPVHSPVPGHYRQNRSVMKLHFGFAARVTLLLLLNNRLCNLFAMTFAFPCKHFRQSWETLSYKAHPVSNPRDYWRINILWQWYSVMCSGIGFFSPSVPAELWKHTGRQENVSVVQPQSWNVSSKADDGKLPRIWSRATCSAFLSKQQLNHLYSFIY